MRIRPGIYTDVTDWMDVGLQLRSGDPLDPVSDNQSVDGGFAMKEIAISEGFAGFRPTRWLDVTLGKFDPGKKWVVTDMQWDDDVTVEGAMEELSFGPLKTDLYQFLLEENGSGQRLLHARAARSTRSSARTRWARSPSGRGTTTGSAPSSWST